MGNVKFRTLSKTEALVRKTEALLRWTVWVGILATVFLTGCGISVDGAGSGAGAHPLIGGGSVRGGQQPLIGARVFLYAIATTTGGVSTSLLNLPGYVLTDLNGNFTITGDYTCPANSYVYLLARGGNPGLTAGVVNDEIALATGLGPCSSLTPSTYITVNEATTVATAYALASFATSETQIGSGFDLGLVFANIPMLVDPVHGKATASSNVLLAPTQKVNTLANSLAACVNSSGTGTACSTLMAAANVNGGSGTPIDTFQAALNIAHNPTLNVQTIYQLSTPNQVFAPTLAVAPTDWTIAAQDLTRDIGPDANSYLFTTSMGNISVELRPDVAPKNVVNFTSYVNSGAYTQSIVHRVVPNFVAQGGGYTVNSSGQINTIATSPAVVDEPVLSNVRGTLAMAKTTANTATDQFYFNLVDNPSLDTQAGGYTVVGQVIGVQGARLGDEGVSLTVMDAIGATRCTLLRVRSTPFRW